LQNLEKQSKISLWKEAEMFSLDYIHNQVIHFPIALLSTSALFDLLGVFSGHKKLYSAAWYTLLLGTIAAIVAVLTGFIADRIYGHMSAPFPIIETHGSMQISASVIFFALLIWRHVNRQATAKPPLIYLIVSVLAVLVLFYGAHLGAGLADRY
jgi:uncharacterized membrane protein